MTREMARPKTEAERRAAPQGDNARTAADPRAGGSADPARPELAPDARAPEAAQSTESPGSPQPGWRRAITVIWSGQAVSILTTYSASFAAMWHITATTGSALYLAVAGIAALAPTGILSPIGGLAADRFDRKRLMIAADSTVGVLSLAIAAIVFYFEAPIGVLLAFLAVRGAAQAFHSPALTAALPTMAPESQLVRINSLSQTLIALAGIVGPVLGIFLYQALGFAGVLALDGAGAAVACLTMARAKVPRLSQRPKTKPLADFAEGLAAFAADRSLGALILFCAAVMLIAMPAGSLFPLMVYQVFEGGGYHASLVEVVWSVGLLVGSAALVVWGGGRRPMRIALAATLALGAGQAACGLLKPGQFAVFAVLAGIMATAIGMFTAPLLAATQKRVPPELLGRVTGLFQTVITLAAPVGLVFTGFGAQRLGLTTWFAVSGTAVVGVAILGLMSRRLRDLDAPAAVT
ncbi:MAG: MFS transporter [Bifidobacteriaceae bacterium]|jgi:DHA3 family macrolide efflux protein-like MFS transporter|nr:MFS transporter [Bifidobacteriaceae bacterium]